MVNPARAEKGVGEPDHAASQQMQLPEVVGGSRGKAFVEWTWTKG